jgi:glutamate-1-semialdehyde 2,1-aminomutase
VSAAAGTTALGIIAEGDVNKSADATAAALRAALNEVLAEAGLPWAVYGTSSGFHLFVNPRGREIAPQRFDAHSVPREEFKDQPKRLVERLRLALLTEGVDVNGRIGGYVSVTHRPAEIAETARAFRAALGMLKAEGEVG